MARKISMIDLAGIGNLLEYLVAADNITCEERDAIMGKKFFGVSTKKTWKVLCKY